MNKTVTLIYADGRSEVTTVATNENSVIFPADRSLFPPEETRAQIEQIMHKGKTYWFARESQLAITLDRVKCVLLSIG